MFPPFGFPGVALAFELQHHVPANLELARDRTNPQPELSTRISLDDWYIAEALLLKGMYIQPLAVANGRDIALSRPAMSVREPLDLEAIAVVLPDTPPPDPMTLETERQANRVALTSFGEELPYFGELAVEGGDRDLKVHLEVEQPDPERPHTWNLAALRLEHLTAANEISLGAHQPFWQNSSDYWGVTTIQRWGYDAHQDRTPQQLPDGGSWLIVSGGWQRQSAPLLEDEPFGELNNPQAGIRFRHGISDDLTLGVTTLYTDEILQAKAEVLYRSEDLPLSARLEALGSERQWRLDQQIEWVLAPELEISLRLHACEVEHLQPHSSEAQLDWNLERQIKFIPAPNVQLNLASDRHTNRLSGSYEMFPGLTLRGAIDEEERQANALWEWHLFGLDGAIAARLHDNDFYSEPQETFEASLSWEQGSLALDFDNQGRSSARLQERIGDFELLAEQSNDTYARAARLAWELTYAPVAGSDRFTIRYESVESFFWGAQLTTLTWSHDFGLSQQSWQWQLGYSVGTLGEGLSSAIATPEFWHGLRLEGTYSGISLDSNEQQFRIELKTD